MKEKIVKEIIEECSISNRKAEELLKISLFYGDTYSEAVKNIRKFCLNKI